MRTLRVLFACACTAFVPSDCLGQITVHAFPLPQRLTPVTSGITVRDYLALQAVLGAEAAQQNGDSDAPAYKPSQFSDLSISPVDLGRLGRAFVVSFNHSDQCGATGNCPMALYIRTKGKLQKALHFGGWGFTLMESANAVPDIVSAWNMSCCEEILTRYRFSAGKFSAIACDDEQTGDDSEDAQSAAVKPCNSSSSQTRFPPPTNFSAGAPVPTYRQLQQWIRLDCSPRAAATYTTAAVCANVPVLKMGHWLAAAFPTLPGSESRVLAYPLTGRNPNAAEVGPAVLRDVEASFVAEGATDSTTSDPVSYPTLILGRWLAPQRMELKQYREKAPAGPQDPRRIRGAELIEDGCEFVVSKHGHWTQEWNPSDLEVRAVPCSGAADSRAFVVDRTPVGSLEQDGSGSVWALTPALSARLMRWNEDQWSPVAGPLRNALPVLQPGPDGGVIIRWTPERPLQWRKADTGRSLEIPSGRTLRLNNGGALLIAGSPETELDILAADGKIASTYHLSAEQYAGAQTESRSPNLSPCFASLTATASRGLTWLWTPGRQGCLYLRGFLTTDGHSFNYHAEINGIQQQAPLSALGVWPDDQVAAGVLDGGLFVIDPNSSTAEPIAPPAGESFRHISAIFSSGRDGYVVSEDDCQAQPGAAERCGTVWRRQAGVWEKMITGLDSTSGVPACWMFRELYCKRELPVAFTSAGIVIAGEGTGLWFLPPNHTARHVTLESNWPLQEISDIFMLKDRLLLVDKNSGQSIGISSSRLLDSDP